MPIYEYECGECGHTFDEIQQMSDPDPDSCPECEGGEVRRLVSESNFQLKGGGWFEDGYSSTSSSGGQESSSSDETSTTGDDGDGGDGGDHDAAAE